MSIDDILEELGNPRVYPLSPRQFEKVEGDKIRGLCGNSSVDYPVFTINRGLRGKVRANTIYHEIAHKLFPWRRHWWIECFAEKMARGGGRGEYSNKYGHTVDDLPPRSRLVELARRASKRYNEKTTTRRKNRQF